MIDDLGLCLSCQSPAAVLAYNRALDARLHAWTGTEAALDEALREAPDFALAHALRALQAAMYMRRAEVGPAIEAAQFHASAATERERSQVAVAAEALQGGAAAALEAALSHVARWPTDAVVAGMLLGAYGMLAMSGRLDHDAARLALLRQLRPHYPADHAWILGHLGWACIEAGELDEGLEHTQRSLALRRANGNMAHVMMHGHFERHDAAAGLAFIEAWLPIYPEDGMLFGHLHWHAALCEIDLGHAGAAMGRLVQQMLRRVDAAPPLGGMADAASMLWRLRLLGREGLPWAAAAAFAERWFPTGGNVFAELHLAMLAAGRGDRAALDAGSVRLRAIADKGHAEAPVALHWNAALGALMAGDAAAAKDELRACRAESVRLGGSHAQRTVVDLTQAWAEAA
jgi:Tfp pilus assembly protein PilF